MTYTNYWHGDLPDARPGSDPDFADEHLDPPELNDIDTEVVVPKDWELEL